MLLSVPMVLAGIAIIVTALRRRPQSPTAARGAP
jgi:prolipoprotein diacylglyceryltransferase